MVRAGSGADWRAAGAKPTITHRGSQVSRHSSIMGGAVTALGFLVLCALPGASQSSGSGAAPGSFREAQELGFDPSIQPNDLLNKPIGAPAGSFRAAQDIRSPIGRDLGGAWARSVDDPNQPLSDGPSLWNELERRF